MRQHSQVEAIGTNKHPVGVFESPGLNAIDPNNESLTEGGSRLGCRTNEIRNRCAARFHDTIAQPAHAPRLLDSIFVAEAKIARKSASHCVGIEHDRAQERRECVRERGFAGSRQTHNENLAFHLGPARHRDRSLLQVDDARNWPPKQAFDRVSIVERRSTLQVAHVD
jgi:hypothetical protein